MLGSQLGIDDVERLLAPLEPVFDEWKQHAVFFVGVMKEGADVTLCVKHRAREPNGLAGLKRRSSTRLHTIISGIHRSSSDKRRIGAPRWMRASGCGLSKEILRSLRAWKLRISGEGNSAFYYQCRRAARRGLKSFGSNCKVCTQRFVAKKHPAPRSTNAPTRR